MFTGIVVELGTVEALEPAERGARVALRAPATAAGARVGDSIALDGCCLTVTAREGELLRFDAVAETLRRTTLGGRRPGDRVNVEPALRVGDRMGGHWVQGHVDAVAELAERRPEGESVALAFAAPRAVLAQTVEKGSICVNGVSLTVTAVDGERFCVAMIPHTAAVTNLGALAVGDRVNVEADILGKYVQALAARGALVRSSAEEEAGG
jgi:riboflavin synthase